ncbi:MAG: response regulator transcription factor [Bradyrhizobium sp.]
MEDRDETEAAYEILAPDAVSSILVGLALSDRTLRLRVISMISRMKAVELENVDDADVILTDTAPAQPGPHLVLGDLPALQSTINGIDKKAGLDILEAAIRLVAHGYQITHSRIERPRSRESIYDDLAAESDELLTARERQVLEKLAAGGSNKSIARDLNISLATAKFHVGSLLTKLGARNRTDAVAIGLKLSLLVL